MPHTDKYSFHLSEVGALHDAHTSTTVVLQRPLHKGWCLKQLCLSYHSQSLVPHTPVQHPPCRGRCPTQTSTTPTSQQLVSHSDKYNCHLTTVGVPHRQVQLPPHSSWCLTQYNSHLTAVGVSHGQVQLPSHSSWCVTQTGTTATLQRLVSHTQE